MQSSPETARSRGKALLALLGVRFFTWIAQGPPAWRLLEIGPSRQVAPVTPGCPLGLSQQERAGGGTAPEGREGLGRGKMRVGVAGEPLRYLEGRHARERPAHLVCPAGTHGQKSRGWGAAGRPCWGAPGRQACPRRGGCGIAVHRQCCGLSAPSFLQEVKVTVTGHYYDRLLLKV